jgi:hypothetical protein
VWGKGRLEVREQQQQLRVICLEPLTWTRDVATRGPLTEQKNYGDDFNALSALQRGQQDTSVARRVLSDLPV